MSLKKRTLQKQSATEARRKRLEDALKANLKKRKQQARGRRKKASE